MNSTRPISGSLKRCFMLAWLIVYGASVVGMGQHGIAFGSSTPLGTREKCLHTKKKTFELF
jgi:hypothetical protein